MHFVLIVCPKSTNSTNLQEQRHAIHFYKILTFHIKKNWKEKIAALLPKNPKKAKVVVNSRNQHLICNERQLKELF